MRGFMKGAIAGGAGAAVVMASSVALAGSGIGGVFNLGQTNSVDETSTLTGSKAGPQLQVTNTNTATTATGLGLNVPSGRAPLTTTSTGRVPNLNADFVDSYHANQLERVGQRAGATFGSGANFSSLATATVAVPKKGFVLVTGTTFAESTNGSCTPCFAWLRVRDLSGDPSSPASYSPPLVTKLSVGNEAFADAAMSQTWVFPALTGIRSYAVEGGIFSPNTLGTFNNSAVTALFLPFGYNGGTTLAPSSAAPQAASPSSDTSPRRNGAVAAP
jgi:hypothetical protein